MKISIEKKEVDKEGKQSLRLVYYFGASVDPATGKRIRYRRREALNMYVYKKPSTPQERQHNKEALKLAESIKAKRTLESQSNHHGLSDSSKLSANFFAYMEQLADSKKTASTSNYSLWLSSIKHLRSYYERPDLTFEQVTPQFLEGFKEFLQTKPLTKSGTKLRSNSVSAYFNKVRAALNQAYSEGIIRDNPLKQVKSIRPKQNKREYLTIEELKAMAKAECRFDVLKRAFLFSCMTGLRWSDIQKLTWSEVQAFNEGHRIIFTQKKTGGLQYLDISPRAVQLMGDPQRPEERVFKGLKYSAWHNIGLLQWALRAGITKHITFHSGRHTFAVLQLTNGTDIYTVSKLLGHSELKTTQIYADIIEQKRREAMLNIPDIFDS